MKTILFLIGIILGSFQITAQTSTENAQSDSTTTDSTESLVYDESASTFEHFIRDGVLDITLSTDFKNFIKEKNKAEYQEAQITYYDKDSTQVVRNVKVRQRGNMRRKICDVPPIKLKIKKDDLKEDGLLPFNTLKFVMPCMGPNIYTRFVLKEYVAYQIYNILTDYSYKTQLVRLHYDDTSGKYSGKEEFGFIIENEDELAARHNSKCIEVTRCHPDKLVRDQATIVYLFEYLIAIKVVKSENRRCSNPVFTGKLFLCHVVAVEIHYFDISFNIDR